MRVDERGCEKGVRRKRKKERGSSGKGEGEGGRRGVGALITLLLRQIYRYI